MGIGPPLPRGYDRAGMDENDPSGLLDDLVETVCLLAIRVVAVVGMELEPLEAVVLETTMHQIRRLGASRIDPGEADKPVGMPSSDRPRPFVDRISHLEGAPPDRRIVHCAENGDVDTVSVHFPEQFFTVRVRKIIVCESCQCFEVEVDCQLLRRLECPLGDDAGRPLAEAIHHVVVNIDNHRCRFPPCFELDRIF